MNIAKYIMLMRCTRYPSKRIGVGPHTTGRDVADKLITTRLPGLPIVENENKEVTGTVTELNVLEASRKVIEEEMILYKEAINVNPDDADSHYKLGVLYLLLENKRSALEEYKILKYLFPSMADGIMRKWNIKTPFSHKNRIVKIRRSFTNILGIAHYKVNRMG